eukprot:720657-Hanusia_phi.AAC.1
MTPTPNFPCNNPRREQGWVTTGTLEHRNENGSKSLGTDSPERPQNDTRAPGPGPGGPARPPGGTVPGVPRTTGPVRSGSDLRAATRRYHPIR